MPAYYLAIDIGASSGRHIMGWLEDGHIRTKEIYRFPNGPSMKNGHLCWDLEGLEHHILEGLKAAHQQGMDPVSIGLDTWGVDFVLLDRAGRRLGDAVCYRDSRTEGMEARLAQYLPMEQHYARTGTAYQSFNTVYQMMALLQEQPLCAEQGEDFLLMPEYLSYFLTGKRAHEWTECSTTALCDPEKMDWAWDVIEAAGLPSHWFGAPILPPGSLLGPLRQDIARQAGFQCQVVLPATHDTGSAYLAVPARDENAAFLSSGTWSLLGMELAAPIRSPQARQAGFTNEGGYHSTTRFLKNIMGLWMLQCLQKENGQPSFAQMAQEAQASGYPAHVFANDPRFMAPASMTDSVKAALAESGAPAPQSPADLYRAVTWGLAACYRDSIRELSQITGRTISCIHIVGGGCQNQVLNQWTANLTGLPVYAGPVEGTALGNLAAQMIALGELSSREQFRQLLADSCSLTTYYPENRG